MFFLFMVDFMFERQPKVSECSFSELADHLRSYEIRGTIRGKMLQDVLLTYLIRSQKFFLFSSLCVQNVILMSGFSVLNT